MCNMMPFPRYRPQCPFHCGCTFVRREKECWTVHRHTRGWWANPSVSPTLGGIRDHRNWRATLLISLRSPLLSRILIQSPSRTSFRSGGRHRSKSLFSQWPLTNRRQLGSCHLSSACCFSWISFLILILMHFRGYCVIWQVIWFHNMIAVGYIGV
jgi:hypothetical protein